MRINWFDRIILFLVCVLIFSCTTDKSENTLVRKREQLYEQLNVTDPALRHLLDSLQNSGYTVQECSDCAPPGVYDNTLAGITEFNEEGIYFNKGLALYNYKVKAYELQNPDASSPSRYGRNLIRLYHWEFNDTVVEKKFEDHLQYINRYFKKYKEHCEIRKYQGAFIQIAFGSR